MRSVLVILLVSVATCLSSESPEDALLDNIVVDCTEKADLSCISKNTYRYLEGTFNNSTSDWQVTDDMGFTRNGRSESTFRQGRTLGEDGTDALFAKAQQFVATHDFTWALPETLFGGAVLRVKAPDQGATSRTLFSVELEAPEGGVDADSEPQEPQERSLETGRFFLKKIFSQKIKKKLLFGFFALLLIIKLIKIKLFFLLPLILGVGTVKKLAIKFLFFVFPALASLFKTCHQHHHHGHVKQYHIHHLKPHHHHDDYHHGPPDYWKRQDAAVPETSTDYYVEPDNSRFSATYASPIDPISQQRLDEEKRRKVQQAYDFEMKQQLAQINKNNVHSAVGIVPVKRGNFNHHAAPLVASAENYDPFYSPILARLDNIFSQMGFGNAIAGADQCRYQLVCQMYQTPEKYAPNSNLVSAELSREPEELQKPQSANEPVRRFFLFVQSAKDGQDQKNCRQLYQGCPVSVEP
ncbi:uncharacterized protein LOC132204222 [Neocloeon triangulifer]|uniref:uncharacterized protein LOC132204222 n=1 Tax=Neocloeon triangulifer TaxID=2078957 RepID=UPI00286EC016|nr:uncharacterized protein LOC132204222 [Neocloeon triangulifer]